MTATATMEKRLPQPATNRVLVRRLPSAWKTKAGIILPHYIPPEEQNMPHDGRGFAPAMEHPREYWVVEVLAVGRRLAYDGETEIEAEVKVGDKVLVSRYAGSDIEALRDTAGDGAFCPRIEDCQAVIEGDFEAEQLEYREEPRAPELNVGEMEWTHDED